VNGRCGGCQQFSASLSEGTSIGPVLGRGTKAIQTLAAKAETISVPVAHAKPRSASLIVNFAVSGSLQFAEKLTALVFIFEHRSD